MKIKYPVFYRVRFWDEFESKSVVEYGVTFAETPVAATEILQNYYGEKEIDAFEVHMLEENALLPMEQSVWENLFVISGGDKAFD